MLSFPLRDFKQDCHLYKLILWFLIFSVQVQVRLTSVTQNTHAKENYTFEIILQYSYSILGRLTYSNLQYINLGFLDFGFVRAPREYFGIF